MKTPSDNFLKIDKAVRVFKRKRSALFWKVDAVNDLFEASVTIIANNYHVELQRIVLPLYTGEQRSIFNEVIQEIQVLHQYSCEASFFKETFEELLESFKKEQVLLKEKAAKSLDNTILKNKKLMELLDHLEIPTKLMKKYPFKMMIILGKRFRKGHALFVAPVPSSIDLLLKF